MTDIKSALKLLTARTDDVYAVVGEVLSVDKATRTCDVRPLNGDADIYDVRLQSTMGDDVGAWYLPKAQTQVIVVFMNNEAGFVAMCSEIDQLEVIVGDQVLRFDASGLAVGSQQGDLRSEVDALFEQLGKLTDTLLQFQLATNVGPTVSVMPQVVQALTQQKTELQQIHTRFKSYLNAT